MVAKLVARRICEAARRGYWSMRSMSSPIALPPSGRLVARTLYAQRASFSDRSHLIRCALGWGKASHRHRGWGGDLMALDLAMQGNIVLGSDATIPSAFCRTHPNVINRAEQCMLDIQAAVEMILAGRRHISVYESMLVAVSGIDGSGKGYVAGLIVDRLRQEGLNARTNNTDGRIKLPSGPINHAPPAEALYHHAIRFEEMFARLSV